jgi:hypothetical protein
LWVFFIVLLFEARQNNEKLSLRKVEIIQ